MGRETKGFLTPEKKIKKKKRKKERKKRKKREQASPVSSCLTKSAINFQTPVSLSQRENTPFRNDKLKEKLLRNSRRFQQRKSDNKR